MKFAREQIAALLLSSALFVAALSLIARALNPDAPYNGLKAVPDIALLLIVLAPLCLLSSPKPSLAAWGTAGCTAIWMLTYAAQRQFLTHTGTFASRPLFVYAAT